MSQYFQIHPDNPQRRLINNAVQMIRKGAVVAYPTDSAYALGCHLEDKKALDRIEDGSFGICESCGEDISIERIKARPVTTQCIECKTKQEAMEKALGL